MPFTRLSTAAAPWSGPVGHQNVALAVLTASVGGLYALALVQLAVPSQPAPSLEAALQNNSSFLAARDVAPSAVGGPLLVGRTAPALRQARQLPAAQKLAGVAAIDLDAIRAGDGAVPRQVAEELPEDLPVIQDVAARKAAFFSAVLPLVLLVNEEIAAERRRLSEIHAQYLAGAKLSLAEQGWLSRLAAKYRVDGADFATLLLRVDTVSPALTLAQAAEESGWGRSRFAQEGNALFGQRTWVRGGGIVPTGRGGNETYEVRAFTTLLESVSAYALNLNTHRSYGDLRALRATMRNGGGDLDAMVLAGALTSYSERGPDYVDSLRAIIRVNGLAGFEKAKLASLPGLIPTQIANRPVR